MNVSGREKKIGWWPFWVVRVWRGKRGFNPQVPSNFLLGKGVGDGGGRGRGSRPQFRSRQMKRP